MLKFADRTQAAAKFDDAATAFNEDAAPIAPTPNRRAVPKATAPGSIMGKTGISAAGKVSAQQVRSVHPPAKTGAAQGGAPQHDWLHPLSVTKHGRLSRNSLAPAIRESSVEGLNVVLAGSIDVAMAARHAHWNVRGANFGSLHTLFGTVWDELNEQIDAVGERASALGGVAGGTIQHIAHATDLPPYPINTFEAQEHLELLADRLAHLGGVTRVVARQADATGDAITSEILIDLCATVDKLLWLAESHTLKPS